jgi:hypothetical protein
VEAEGAVAVGVAVVEVEDLEDLVAAAVVAVAPVEVGSFLHFNYSFNHINHSFMKKLTALLVICLWVISIHAQTIKVNIGKKIQTVSVITLKTTVNQMGTEMVIPTTANVNIDFELKSVTNKEITLTSTLKRVTGDITVMGNEQKYDSDDSTTAKNPMAAEALKDLNKPKDIIVKVGKPSLTNDISGAQSGEEIANGLFIPVDAASAKEGFSWIDSSSSTEGSKMVNNYTLNKVSKEEVTVKVISTNTLITTRQQMGMEMKVNMQGTTEGMRIYNVSTGLLKSASNTFTSSGNNEIMGNSIPVSIKGTAFVTVK